MQIKKVTENRFKVWNGEYLSNFEKWECELSLIGRELKYQAIPNLLQIGPFFTVKLGPLSYGKIKEMKIGQTLDF